MSSPETPSSLLEFPCSFPIKVMGRNVDGFDTLVVGLVRRHSPDLYEGAVSTRLSREGRFMSVTITIEAQSKVQLDAIYYELTANERVLMAF